jgi:hypothetical protein
MGLSVMVFIGYTLKYIKENPLPGVFKLLETTDLLVDGPYMVSLPETRRNWTGATNVGLRPKPRLGAAGP